MSFRWLPVYCIELAREPFMCKILQFRVYNFVSVVRKTILRLKNVIFSLSSKHRFWLLARTVSIRKGGLNEYPQFVF